MSSASDTVVVVRFSRALVSTLVTALAVSYAQSPATGADLTIPWAIGGERIERDGSRGWFPGDWPTVPVESMRIWDARTAWLNIEPVRGQFTFDRLDAFVAKASSQGVRDIVLVLGGTPRWASERALGTDASWMGPGSASPPRDLDDWARFVRTVVDRYAGRITAYEIWNEPNSVMFWNGTVDQWAELTSIAVREIREADVSARVIVGGFTVGSALARKQVPAFVRAARSAGVVADAWSLHWYPTSREVGTGARPPVALLLSAAGRSVSPSGSVLVTEVNVRGGAALSRDRQRLAVRALERRMRSVGVERWWWYAWTDLGPADLMPIYPKTAVAQVLGQRDTSKVSMSSP